MFSIYQSVEVPQSW